MVVEAKGNRQKGQQPKPAPEIAEPGAPRYLTMAAELRSRIITGELQPGDRLPSFSEMRRLHGSTVATVERIYGVLEREGLVERRQGVGTFVTMPHQVLTGTIGLLGIGSQQRQQFAYYAQVIEGIESAADEYGKHLLFMGSSRSWNKAAAEKVDGVLLFNVSNFDSIVRDFRPNLPYISIMTTVAEATSVVADDYGGAKQAVKHLVSLGHRRIAFLMEKLPTQLRMRFAGYHDALMEAGIEPDSRWVCPTSGFSDLPHHLRPTYLDWGRENMQTWLREGWTELGCTAIFAQNDNAALGVLQALQEAGIQVPDQVSLIGFDGTEVCNFARPQLTAVEVPLAKIGSKAVQVLMQQMETKERDSQVVVLPTRIKMGESTAPSPK